MLKLGSKKLLEIVGDGSEVRSVVSIENEENSRLKLSEADGVISSTEVTKLPALMVVPGKRDSLLVVKTDWRMDVAVISWKVDDIC